MPKIACTYTCTGNVLTFHTHSPSGYIDVYLSHIHLMGAILQLIMHCGLYFQIYLHGRQICMLIVLFVFDIACTCVGQYCVILA